MCDKFNLLMLVIIYELYATFDQISIQTCENFTLRKSRKSKHGEEREREIERVVRIQMVI